MENKLGITINYSSFTTLLTILFIGLKLGHVIDWSWWWVLSPIWLPLGLIFIVIGVIWLLSYIAYRKMFRKQ